MLNGFSNIQWKLGGGLFGRVLHSTSWSNGCVHTNGQPSGGDVGVGGRVVAVLTAVSGVLVAARRKLQAVDNFLSRVQNGLAAVLGLFSRRQAQNDASTSPMASPEVSGAPGFRNATDSDQLEMRRCERGGGRTMWV